MSSVRQRIVLLAVLGALALLGGAFTPRAVSAHAFLVRTQPANGTVVSANIGQVLLTFTEPVDVRPDRVQVADGAGRRVDLGDAHLAPGDATTVVVALPQLPNGVYTVRYALISSDTHPVGGTLRFGVGVAPADVLAGATTQETGLSGPVVLQAVGRWLNLLGLILLVGPIAFRFFVLAPIWPRGREAVATDAVRLFEARSVRWAWIGVTVLIAGQVVGLAAASLASTLGTTAEALQPNSLLATLNGRFGTLWLGRFALLLVPSLTLPIISAEQEIGEARPELARPDRGRGGWLAMLIGGAALAALTAFAGHAATTAPVLLSVLVDWVHLAATILWIGGLLALALIFPGIVRSLGATEGLATLATAVPRFSALALGCVQALALTGFYQVWVHVDRPASLVQTLYGGTLLVKLIIIVPLLALGAVNRLVITPRLRAAAAAADGEARVEAVRATTRRFWRTLWGEAALGVAVLGVVGLLTALPPARTVAASAAPADSAAAPAASGSVTLASSAGTALVNLTIGPTGTGPATLAVTLRDPTGTAINDATVSLRLFPPGGAAPQDVPLTARSGRYTGLGDLGSNGAWRIEATVTPKGGAPATTSFALNLPTGGALSILAASDAAMNKLTSVRERQTLGAGGPTTTTTYEWSAPDKMHLTSDTGSETIVVGKRRFDRTSGGQWVASDWPDPNGYRWPDNEYAKTAAEVTILGTEQIDGVTSWVITFLDTSSEARYTFWIGQQDGLVRQQRMFAVGHYMESHFSDFNAPITIAAPGSGP